MAIAALFGRLDRRENLTLGRVGRRLGSGRETKMVAEETSQGEIVGRSFRVQFGIEAGDFEQVIDDLIISFFCALDGSLHHPASRVHYELSDEATHALRSITLTG